MKAIGNYNVISEGLRNQIPVLKPDEVKVFQMLNGLPNNDPDAEVKRKYPQLFGKTQLLTRFRIWDKYANPDKEGKKEPSGGYADVVLADGWDSNNQPTKAHTFVAGSGEAQFMGKFELRGGNVQDQELFEVLYLSPEREGSPCADSRVLPKFKILDYAADSKATMTKHDVLLEALNKVKTLSKKDMEALMASQNRTFGTEEELKAAVSVMSRETPDKFLQLLGDPNTKIKATIKEALDKEIIKFNHENKEVTEGKNSLTFLKDGEDVIGDIASWIRSAKNGKQVLSAIETQLQPKAE